eukprot:jgi/Mesvir1/20362/Mv19944-RA.1
MAVIFSSSTDTTSGTDTARKDTLEPRNDVEENGSSSPHESGCSGSEDDGDDDVFDVECIVGYRCRGGVPQWKVRWLGYPPSEDTWEPRDNLEGCEKTLGLLLAFEEQRLGNARKAQANAPQRPTRHKAKAEAKAEAKAPRPTLRKAPAAKPKGDQRKELLSSAATSEDEKEQEDEDEDEDDFVGADVFDDNGEFVHKLDDTWLVLPTQATLEREKKEPLPTKLYTLELFSGAGGLHMEGFLKSLEGGLGETQVSISVVAAVEIEAAPVATYRRNFPAVNTVHMGICRFLATVRRLMTIKRTRSRKKCAGEQVTGMRINFEKAHALTVIHKGTLKKQGRDVVTQRQYDGEVPLRWLEFKVSSPGKKDRWVTDAHGLAASAAAYLKSDAFGPHVFPLPGDVHVIAGGPPCQGFSGYNTTRVMEEDLKKMLTHPENALLVRFLEAVWLFRPLFMVMEEVPAVAKEGVIAWMKCALTEHSYQMVFDKRVRTGAYGCPQTRDRLILMGSRAPAILPRIPTPICEKFEVDEGPLTAAFLGSDRCYPLPMERQKYATAKHPATTLLRSLVLGDSLTIDLPRVAQELTGRSEDMAETLTVPYTAPPPTPYACYLRKDCADATHVSNHIVQELNGVDKLRCAAVPFVTDASWRHMDGFTSTMYEPKVMVVSQQQWVEDHLGSRTMRCVPDYMRVHKEGSDAYEKENKAFVAGTGTLELRHGWHMEPLHYPLVPFWCLTNKHGGDENCYGRLPYEAPHMTVHSYNQPHWHASLVPFYPRVLSVREKARVQGFPDHFHFCGTVKEQYKQIANAVSPQLAKAIARSILEALWEALGWRTKPSRQFSPSLQNFADFMASFNARQLKDAQQYPPCCMAGFSPLEGPKVTACNRTSIHGLVIPTPPHYQVFTRDGGRLLGHDTPIFPILPRDGGRLLCCPTWRLSRLTARNSSPPPPVQSKEELAPMLPKTMPMTYEEILIFYNTVQRRDHSNRFCTQSPFNVLRVVEEKHPWCGPEVKGLAWRRCSGSSECLQVAIQYRGFNVAEWYNADAARRKGYYWDLFVKQATPEVVNAVLSHKKDKFLLPGTRCVDKLVYEPNVQAECVFDAMEARYKKEQAKGWIPTEMTEAQAAAVKKEKAAKNALERQPKLVQRGAAKRKTKSASKHRPAKKRARR